MYTDCEAGAGAGRRLRGPEPGTEDNSICDEASQFTEGERPRPQGSSPVEEFPESDKYGDSDKECEAEHDPYRKSGKKPKKSGLGSIFDKRSTPKMSKLKEAPSPEAGVIVKTAKDGGAEGLVYSGGGKDGIFIKEVVPESPASKNLHLKEGDQVLSATVYFDNMPYEDAIQILEHAQAYKVKLCLKRKPELTETEGAIDSDAIPEDEVHQPEMREPGKKRRGDARISWPKFPTLGRGKKSRFTRSHSSSEADEQRKLELSPTTSDTESPIKSQDALKGKKKHKKIKLPGLKRGRISSSEDTDAQNIQTEEMISPECLESPSREILEKDEEPKKDDDVKVEESETETHKAELVCLDSTLKTTDITAALVEEEIPCTTESPDGKKKKKERSELKLKILGRDKKNKAKSSPKRLKTLGASLDKENEKTEAAPENVMDSEVPKMSSSKSSQMELRLPKVEIDISDVGIICKSTDKKVKSTEEKQAKTGFKMPKVDDAYDRLLIGTELPKREDIEIPGMEDISKIKDFKEPKAPLATISDAEFQAEAVQMSIDVDSVKEAVSKLPGYKLPKVDISGVPIPEEITVIDANAQRISVKTPTKGKHESKSAFAEVSKTTIKLPIVKADVSGGEIISETKMGVKKLELDSKDAISTKAIISQTIEVEKVQKESIKISCESVETSKELDVKIKKPKVALPDLSIGKPDIRFPDFKIDVAKTKDDKVRGERTIFLQEDKTDVKVSDVQISPIQGEFEIASKDSDAKLKLESEEKKVMGEVSVEKQEKGRKFKMPTVGISVPKVKEDVSGTLHVTVPEVETDKPTLEIKPQQIQGEKESTFGIKLKGPEVSLTKKDKEVTLPEAKLEVDLPKIADVQITSDLEGGKVKPPSLSWSSGYFSPRTKVDVKVPSTEIESEGQGGKFKMPKLGVKLPKVKGPEFDISLTSKDKEAKADKTKTGISSPEKKTEVQNECEVEGKGGKFKMPKLGITKPKMKGPDIELNLSKKDIESSLPDVKADIKMPDPEINFNLSKELKDVKPIEVKVPEVDITVGKVVPEGKIEIEKTSVEIKPFEGKLDIKKPKEKNAAAVEEQSGKFKIPRFTIAIPKVKGPEIDSNLEKKEIDVTLPEAKIEADRPVSPKIDVEVKEMDVDIEGQGGKFKLPKLGIKMPKVRGPDIDISRSKKEVKSPEIKVDLKVPEIPKVDRSIENVDIKIPETKIEIEKPKVPDADVKPPSGKIKIKAPDIDVSVTEDSPSKFKMPSLGISVPKMKAPEVDLSFSKKDEDVTMPDVKVEAKLPEKADVKAPEVEVSTKTSPLKFTMPSFKLPKFGGSIEEKDSEIKIEATELSVSVPQANVDLPDVSAEVHVPETEVKAFSGDVVIEQPSSLELDVKFKKPKFSLPRFSFTKQSVPAPEVDISAPEVNIPQPEGKMKVEGEIEMKAPELEAQIYGQGSKFKLPKFGISMPKISTPDLDLSLPKKDVEVTVPEAKVEGKLADVEVKAPSIKAEIKTPEVKVETKTKEGSPSKLKMPTFKLPKFGASIPEAEIKVEGTDVEQVDVDLPEVKAEVHLPEVDIKPPSVEVEIEQPSDLEMDAKFKKPRFSLPRFSFTKQNVPAPEVDISAPEVRISQPEGKVKVKGEMEVKAPELEAQIDGQGSKFKLPKFGISMPKISTPDLDLSLPKKDVQVTLPEAKVEGKLADIEVKAPSIEAEIKVPEVKVETKTKEGSPSKLKMPTFKLPKFGASIPEAEIKVERSHIKKVDVDLPEVKAEVHLPEVDIKPPSVEVEIEQPSDLEMDAKFKKPKFSLPRFSFSKQSVPAPEVDITAPEVNISQPKGKMEVGEVEMKAPDLEAQTDGQGGRFKLPKFGISMPKISAPDVDLSLSKKDVEVTLPEAKIEEAEIKVKGTDVEQVDVDLPEVKAEVHLPEVDIKPPSVEVEIEQPSDLEMDAKFKKPRFSLPRFSFSKQSVPAPEVDISAPEVNISQPEGKVKVKGEMEVKAPELEAQIDGQGSKFKLPKFGISMPKISAPDVDLSLSKKDVEVTLPEAKVEGKLADIEIKAPSIEAEIKVPEVKVETKTKEGSPSKLKMPTFKLPKFGASIPEAEIKVEELMLDK
ncbi:hypothetical protein WMY93_017296 [Mugilogobius chulae]|uniref:PDZ domain-containing protein n=1 Tax=Mugilogobius chulae TaxID=88201 RepID=A0AAW0NU77_9GOBI